MKVRYLYSGARKSKFKGEIGKDFPDTQFYGLNHLAEFGIQVDFREVADLPLGPFIQKTFGFRMAHILLYIFSIGQDVVFGSSLLYPMVWRILWRTKTKAVLLNISMTRVVTLNQKKRVGFLLIKALLRRLDAVVCLAEFQREFLERHFPFLKGKTYFVPLGVDVGSYTPVFDARKPYFFSVGRDNGRDYKTVIEVARIMPESEFHIACSARNLEGVGEIPTNVKVFIDLPLLEVKKKWAEAALLLLITHADTFTEGADCSGQTVLLEAMASGIPIVVSRKIYLADYAADGKEAAVVECYDAPGINRTIELLMKDPTRRLQMARAARERIERDFSTRRMGQRLSEVFRTLSPSSTRDES